MQQTIRWGLPNVIHKWQGRDACRTENSHNGNNTLAASSQFNKPRTNPK